MFVLDIAECILSGFVVAFQKLGLPDQRVAVVHPITGPVQGDAPGRLGDDVVEVGARRLRIYGSVRIDVEELTVIILVLLVQFLLGKAKQFIGIEPVVVTRGKVVVAAFEPAHFAAFFLFGDTAGSQEYRCRYQGKADAFFHL
ncbi:MAG: hypothetical protein DYG98_22555 [Haliscomenobacteraceae bacterium CHB4]|nr:hypothetical protein [Haliscomenobacteraceae bacterium CHB4]